jgi:hypothetical protein
MTNFFTEQELLDLSHEVDAQFRELAELKTIAMQKGEPPADEVVLAKQYQAIAELTKEPPRGFLAKFGKAAKADLCDENGLLHKQWMKWGDLDNKDTVERLGAVLMTMGISGGVVRAASQIPQGSLVSGVVVIVVHIGIKAFCEDYGQ